MKIFVDADFSSCGSVGKGLTLGAVVFALLVSHCAIVFAEEQTAEEQDRARVTGLSAQKIGKSGLEVRIQGGSNLAYTSYNLPDPERVVVDIANASLQEGLLPKMPVDTSIKLQTKEVDDTNPQILRFEFTTGETLPYTARQDGNDVLLNFNLEKVASAGKGRKSRKGRAVQSSQATPTASQATAQPSTGNEEFGFSGYERERISVDFYKMDLHNVFRFLREVSGTNIIVDESVHGTLTLTLDNVPWDFALDVILNLKDLKSVERYNTIVIYPKKKDFTWPGKAKDTLSFKTDEKLSRQESLVITQVEQQQAVGMGVAEAAQLIAKGREFERARNPAMAAQTYEQAFEKWKSNAKLANRISTIYLVDLRQNAKALQYAKRALAINKRDSVAALNAAIASANMRDMTSAASYFDMSVQGKRPAQEALVSYALFREEARQYDQALQILAKHDALYGRSLEAMVARARILDKRGASAQAVQAYRAILSSGFSLPADLSRFVRARVGMTN